MALNNRLTNGRLNTRAERNQFHHFRNQAYQTAVEVYENRAGSYNEHHEPLEEMVFGGVSLASEIHKRALRMVALMDPVRNKELTQEDLNRLVDLCIDTLNYSTWFVALCRMSGVKGHKNSDDKPNYMKEKRREE